MPNTQKLNMSISPSNADKTLSWATTNSAVASVADDGTVTGLSVGSAKITATTINNLVAECDVVVGQMPQNIALNKTTAEFGIGITNQLSVIFTPTNTTEKEITWSSSDDAVATVSSTGLVTGQAIGSCTITATSINNLTATCSINIIKTIQSISLSPSSASNSYPYLVSTLTATITPSDFTLSNDTNITISPSYASYTIANGNQIKVTNTRNADAANTVTVKCASKSNSGIYGSSSVSWAAPTKTNIYSDSRFGTSLTTLGSYVSNIDAIIPNGTSKISNLSHIFYSGSNLNLYFSVIPRSSSTLNTYLFYYSSTEYVLFTKTGLEVRSDTSTISLSYTIPSWTVGNKYTCRIYSPTVAGSTKNYTVYWGGSIIKETTAYSLQNRWGYTQIGASTYSGNVYLTSIRL